MAQPKTFAPTIRFADSPTIRAEDIDAVFAEVKTTLDALVSNSAALQRDDTKLANSAVHPRALSSAALALFSSTWDYQGDWITGTSYTKNQTVTNSQSLYLVVVDHTAGTLLTDISNHNLVKVLGEEPANDILSHAVTGSANAYIIAPSNGGNYLDGETYYIVINTTNTGASTLNRDAVGAKNIYKNGRTLVAGELVSGRSYLVRYNNSLGVFELQSATGDFKLEGQTTKLSIKVTSDILYDISASRVVLIDANGNPYYITNYSITGNNITNTIGNTFSEASDTWYQVYLFSDGATNIVRLIPDGSTPSEDASYIYSAKLGYIYNDSSSDLVKTVQTGNRVDFTNATQAFAEATIGQNPTRTAITFQMPTEANEAIAIIRGLRASSAANTKLYYRQKDASTSSEHEIMRLTAGTPEAITTVFLLVDGNGQIELSYSETGDKVEVNQLGFILR